MRKIGTTGVLMIACIVAVFGRQNMAEAQKKITVVEGGEKVLTTDVYKTKTSVNNKKKAKVYKQYLDASDKISTLADKPDKALFVKGIKPGKAQVKVNTTTGETIYEITILSKEKVKKKARKLLKKEVKNKVIAKRCFTEKEIRKIQKLYYSSKRHLLNAEMEGKTAVRFALFDREKIIGRRDREIRFLKVKEKKGKIYYVLNDESYDQDDYWYQPYTEEEMNEFLKKQIPDAKEIRINR